LLVPWAGFTLGDLAVLVTVYHGSNLYAWAADNMLPANTAATVLSNWALVAGKFASWAATLGRVHEEVSSPRERCCGDVQEVSWQAVCLVRGGLIGGGERCGKHDFPHHLT